MSREIIQSYCVLGGVGEGGERERERGERERTSSLSQSVKVVVAVVVFPAYFVSCHGPCAPKEK